MRGVLGEGKRKIEVVISKYQILLFWQTSNLFENWIWDLDS